MYSSYADIPINNEIYTEQAIRWKMRNDARRGDITEELEKQDKERGKMA